MSGHPESVFAAELGQVIGPTEQLFLYDDRLVEVIEHDFSGQYDRFKLAKGGLNSRRSHRFALRPGSSSLSKPALQNRSR
jgi:hypothetical protein